MTIFQFAGTITFDNVCAVLLKDPVNDKLVLFMQSLNNITFRALLGLKLLAIKLLK